MDGNVYCRGYSGICYPENPPNYSIMVLLTLLTLVYVYETDQFYLVNLGMNVTKIDCGDYSVCALSTVGSLLCWGLNVMYVSK